MKSGGPALLALGLVLGSYCSGGCEGGPPKRAGPGEACEKPGDCAYGTECRSGAGARACALLQFGDCEGDRSASGAPTCLSGQRCRDGHCTVECVADPECKAGQVCRIGACEKGSKELRQCAENRDCAWPETCYFGQCVAKGDAFRCNTDLDCGAGHRCVGGRCL